MEIIFGHSEKLAKIAEQKLKQQWGTVGFGSCQALGVATGKEPHDQLLAVIVYHDLHPEYGTCQVSICSWSPLWAQKGIIKAILSVPFEQYGVKKLCSQIAKDNTRALKFNLGIGFKQEAVLKNQLGANRHLCITYLMEPEYRKRYCGEKSISLSDIQVV